MNNETINKTLFEATMNKYAQKAVSVVANNATKILTNPVGAIAATTITLGTMYFVNENIKDKRKYKYANKEEAKAEC